MFEWLFKEKNQFTLENESIAKEIYKQVLLLNKKYSKYKARVVMNHIQKSFASNEALDDLYEKIYLKKDFKKDGRNFII